MSFARSLGRRGSLTRPWPLKAAPRPRRRGSGARRLRFTPRLRLILLLAALTSALLLGGWFWLRDSSLVAVERVTVKGQSGPDAGAIRLALSSAARNMTTLDVNMAALRSAVASFPEVKSLRVKTVFPHRMVIRVIEERPVAMIEAAGREIPVAADRTLLRSVSVGSQLPVIPLSVLPVGRRVIEASAVGAVALLAAAPYQLLPRISQVARETGHGLVAQLRGGPSLYFGDATQPAAKWAAVLEVLGDPGSAGAAYIDVTDPGRPAAGAGTGTGAGASADTGTSAGSGSSANPATSADSGASTSTAAGSGTSTSTATGTSADTGAGAAATGTDTGAPSG